MLSAYCTDVGNVKKVNQDALLIMEAALDSGSLMFAAVCDGMGGLLNGEHASTVLTDALGKWFREEAVLSAASGMTRREMIDSLNRTILSVDSSLYSYSRSKGDCGTTLTGLILCRGRYLCVNVGDSRAYRMNSGGITQITRDQTVVQQMLDRGEISEKEAKTHPDQSVLLQCVGAGKEAGQALLQKTLPALVFPVHQNGIIEHSVLLGCLRIPRRIPRCGGTSLDRRCGGPGHASHSRCHARILDQQGFHDH